MNKYKKCSYSLHSIAIDRKIMTLAGKTIIYTPLSLERHRILLVLTDSTQAGPSSEKAVFQTQFTCSPVPGSRYKCVICCTDCHLTCAIKQPSNTNKTLFSAVTRIAIRVWRIDRPSVSLHV